MLRDHIARAMSARQRGDLDTALAEARILVDIAPLEFSFHQFLGEVLLARDDLEGALNAFDRAVALAPAEPGLRRAIALLAMMAARPALAAGHLSKITAPTAEDLANLADCLAAADDYGGAINAYGRLLELRPDSVDALVALSGQLIKARRPAEAEPVLRRALALAPDDADALTNLGLVLLRAGEVESALTALERAARHPQPPLAALVALSTALQQAGRFAEGAGVAQAALAQAPADQPHAACAAITALAPLGRSAETADLLRRVLSAPTAPPPAIHSRLLLALQYLPDTTPDEMLAHARRANRPLVPAPPPPPERSWAPDRRLRIGYVSTDFREHACRYYLEPLIENHHRSEVEVVCYAEVAHPDPVTRRFQASADLWRDTTGLDDHQLAELIRSDRIDILVDLAGHCGDSRLAVFAHRPAPVQVATLIGYSATTGLDDIDYLLGDPYLTPPGCEAGFSERIIRLPRIIAPFRPRADWPEPAPPSEGGPVVFGCLADAARVDDRMIGLWRSLLERVPDSRILFKQVQFDDPATREAWRSRLGDIAGRVDLEGIPGGWGRNMEVYSRLDIVLDSPLHSGNTTVLIPLWMGIPVVSLAGANSWQRAGASILGNLGVADLIAETDAHYLDIACGLAQDRSRRQDLRHRLRAMMRNSAVCDEGGVVADIEAAYRRIWREATSARH
jgi:protein O-GlcNAc transferase